MTDDRAMAEAIAMARSALGRTAPRPGVGAVLVRDGAILGRGATRPEGPHAETEALRDARANGHDPRGATLYVTLEPCNHFGRTPPCTDAILAAGVARVVVGVLDPWGPMNGRSVELLRNSGVAVDVGVGADDAARVHRGFLQSVRTGLPDVTLKVATSLDGRIATSSGESRWLTGEGARARARWMRSEHDAIVVGLGTVNADDPRLTARIDGRPDPVPVVLDSELAIAPDRALFAHPRGAIVVCADDAPARDLPATILRVPRGPDGHADLAAAMRALVERGLHRVFVEGGGRVHRAFLDAGLVDTVAWFTAGLVLPGGLPSVGGPPAAALADARRFALVGVEAVDGDLLSIWEPRASSAGA